MNEETYSDTLKEILQGVKFKRKGASPLYYFLQDDELIEVHKHGPTYSHTRFEVDYNETTDSVLVLEQGLVGKRVELRIYVRTEIDLL